MSDTFGGLFLRDAPGAPVKTNRVVVMTMLLVVGSLLGLASIGGSDDPVSTAAAVPTGEQHRPPAAVATQDGTTHVVGGTTHRSELRSDGTVASSRAPTGEYEDAVPSEAAALPSSSSSSGAAAGSSSASDVRRARALLPTDAIGDTVSMPYSYAQAWKDPGDLGWRKLSRRAGESCLSCEAAVKAVQRVHDEGSKRYHAFKSSPAFKMPWYYHDSPAPVCGQALLWHLQGGPKHVFTVRPPKSRLLRRGDSECTVSTDYDSLPVNKKAAAALAAQPNPNVAGAPPSANLDDMVIGGAIDDAAETIYATLGERVDDVTIADCGTCGSGAGSAFLAEPESECSNFADVLVTARLVGANGFVPATVSHVKRGLLAVSFAASLPGIFALEVKVVHVAGQSDDPTRPRSLGVIGIRAVDGGRKAFKYNSKCDEQRHVFGSPLRVVVVPAESSAAEVSALPLTVTAPFPVPPFCTAANHTEGRWVRFAGSQVKPCSDRSNPFCFGSAGWLTDAAAYNTDFLWAPAGCRYVFFDAPHGPAGSCLTVPESSRVFLLLVGDSVTREYTKNCLQFDLRKSRLHCLFANIALEGQHYSTDYARSVARVVVENVKTNNAGVFATNLGIHHMIGPCTTAQWTEFVKLFVEEWKKDVVWNPKAHAGRMISATPASRAVNLDKAAFPALYPKGTAVAKLERAIWIGPPSIHYARKGMGSQRAVLWDRIAWELLEPLGFERVRAIAPTAPRQEGTWDGLHYASERNKVQTRWRNKDATPRQWNGGVANMLFTMLLNLVCYGGPNAV